MGEEGSGLDQNVLQGRLGTPSEPTQLPNMLALKQVSAVTSTKVHILK